MVVCGLGLWMAMAGPAAAGECPPAGHAGVVECPTTPVDPVDPAEVEAHVVAADAFARRFACYRR